ncbi:hypothetical protein [Cyanobacterium aponinum]|uniref:hypothetical protein n=1 Tax=Cyanobacterium aponinum TaxID=379064 RepID=UPI000C129F8D|nr:hypothetical protein [Cyanobacterium aponinum]PHV62630.1 hypothetical protein CSQ80_09405 [Cyanobacterium aponinum IPPAS B-1201]
MNNILKFKGVIKNVIYNPRLIQSLKLYSFQEFNINICDGFGLIQLEDKNIAYSKWVSPKRTRSYPFARMYNTYSQSKVITIIPIIKDEGKDGDLDKIGFTTFCWMNLLNIYIILGYYEDAEKSQKKGQISKDKLSEQKFNNNFIKQQIEKIFNYKQSALHWNKNLFENEFINIFNLALNCYKKIENKTGVKIHNQDRLREYLKDIQTDFEEFKNISLKFSQQAINREIQTEHNLEYLVDGCKGVFEIENDLGGIYHLTADEIIIDKQNYIIQESKNSSKKCLPSLDDIQDGLFKLILYSNLDHLYLEDQELQFSCRLKLTGNNIKKEILLSESTESQELEKFIENNIFILTNQEVGIIYKLLLEVKRNKKLNILITNNG